MTDSSKRIAVGMSGGIDSSVSAFLLQQQGYDVVGLSAKMTSCGGKTGEDAQKDAAKVCDFLGIEFYTVNLTKEFDDKIVSYFIDSYKYGKTPNPCAVCNKAIKWGAMYEYAKKELNCNLIATGHYAIIEDLEGKNNLKRSTDKLKDQTYMLINLTQEDLSHTLFPLGHLTKEEVKAIARENNLPTAETPESQDVCFINKPETVQTYLEGYLKAQPGPIIDCSTDEVIGEHSGYYRYTIGQRKGIKVSYPYPLYVISIDAENNIVYVGAKEDIESDTLIADNVNWVTEKPSEKTFFALTKIRYNSKPKLSQLELIDDNCVSISFENPQFAITPGQVAAFYTLDNKYLIGGGWIQ